MIVQSRLDEYVAHAMGGATYAELEDGTYTGRVPSCPGVVAFGADRETVEHELQATLEDWSLLGLKLGHHLPIIDGIDLNAEAKPESLGAV